MAKVLNAPTAFNSAVIVINRVTDHYRVCLVCQNGFLPDEPMVLFDRNESSPKVTQAHGTCIRQLAQYFISDEELEKAFEEYRVKLLNRYAP